MWIHTVVPGDTLRGIADAHNTTVKQLLHLNELSDENRLVPGQHLLTPGPPTLAEVYTWRADDTVRRVAERIGVSEAALAAWVGAVRHPAEGLGYPAASEGAASVGGEAGLHMLPEQAPQANGDTGLATSATTAAAPFGATAPADRAGYALAGAIRLAPGAEVPVPRRIRQRRAIDVHAYLVPEGKPSDARRVREVADRLTHLSVFHYSVKPDGTLTPQPDTEAVRAARRANIQPLMTVTNFDGTQFHTELAHTVMANPSLRRKVVQSALSTARQRGFGGIQVDFERMRPSDRALFTAFVEELAAACRSQGLSISVALPPKQGDNPNDSRVGVFDDRSLGAAVDFVMLMSYEWGWAGGPPMADITTGGVQQIGEGGFRKSQPCGAGSGG